MTAARAADVQVLLGFGHSRSAKRKVRRYVPGVREFTKEFLKYKKRYPWVKDWLTWNEANHCGEPTCHKAAPRRPLLQQHQAQLLRLHGRRRPTCWTPRRCPRG